MNEIEIRFRTNQRLRIVAPRLVPDNRYRCLVMLQRSDRPRFWNFRCHNCGSKVAELMNQEVVAINDFFDPQNVNNHGVGRHCKGMLPDNIPCPYSYYFQLS